MSKTRRMVTLLSLFALLLVNIVAIGLLSSSAYEVKSGQQPSGTGTEAPAGGSEAVPPAPAPSDAAPVVEVPKPPAPAAGKTTAKQPAAAEEERDDATYDGFSIISGTKFEDLNCNGVQDPGEPGLPGVTITCTYASEWLKLEHSAVSGADGGFSFPWCIAGSWMIKEHGLDGYYPTTPVAGVVTVGWWDKGSINFGNARYANIQGYKFEDLNCNGVQDPGEPGLPGVSITLTGPDVWETTVSGADGWFYFNNLKAGSYTVSEDPATCPDHFPTTPTSVGVDLAPGETGTVYFGNAPDEEEVFGSIEGYKFLDLDADGVMDGSDPGLPGITVRLSGNGIDPVQTVTDSFGHFRFDQLKPGDYLVELVNDPPAYYLTTPGQYAVGLSPLETETVFFGNALYGKITGHKYEDSNGNGNHDAGEPPLEGVTINLLVNGEIVATTVTNASGSFEFDTLKAGLYAVQEIVPDGFYNTSPVEVEVLLEAGDTGQVEFLNARHGKVFGYKWLDLDADGVLDDGEPPMEGVTIQLASMGGGFAAFTTTGENGYYEFTGLLAGSYRVSEIVPDGYFPTSPYQVEFTLDSGGSRRVDFLNASLQGSIAGTKWDDRNGNGKVDGGEAGLAGVTIQLWVGIELKDTRVSAADGTYAFESLAAGDYIVMEVMPQDRYATSTTSIPVALTAGEDRTGVDFLNAPYASITGNKWDDPDQDGVHTSDEAPVPGVTITLSRNGYVDVQVVTDSDGAFSFGKLEAGTYTVTETLPTGSRNTTPLSVTVTLEPGERAVLTFLNVTVGGDIIIPPDNPSSTTEEGHLPLTGMNQFTYYLAAALLAMAGMLLVLMGLFRNRRPVPGGGGTYTTPVSDRCRFDKWV